MGEKKSRGERNPETLERIWRIPDAAWERIEPMLREAYPSAPTGRKRIDWRAAFDGIMYRMRTGCQWNRLPKEFGDDSSVHRWFQRWVGDGIFEAIWAELLRECEELGGVTWTWQAADCVLSKSRFDGEKRGRIRPTAARRQRRRACSSRRAVALSG